jgi:hypothetical protein
VTNSVALFLHFSFDRVGQDSDAFDLYGGEGGSKYVSLFMDPGNHVLADELAVSLQDFFRLNNTSNELRFLIYNAIIFQIRSTEVRVTSGTTGTTQDASDAAAKAGGDNNEGNGEGGEDDEDEESEEDEDDDEDEDSESVSVVFARAFNFGG